MIVNTCDKHKVLRKFIADEFIDGPTLIARADGHVQFIYAWCPECGSILIDDNVWVNPGTEQAYGRATPEETIK